MLESSWEGYVRKDVASDSMVRTWSAVLSLLASRSRKTADDSCFEARQKRKTSRKIRTDDEGRRHGQMHFLLREQMISRGQLQLGLVTLLLAIPEPRSLRLFG